MDSSSSRYISIFGYYGFQNAGDEAILLALTAELRHRAPGCVITVASATPEQTARAHGVRSFLWSDTLQLVNCIETSDLILVGGGGLFHDYFGFDPNAFLSDQQTGIAYYASPVILGAMFGKPTMLYAVGVGPLLTEQGKLFTRVAGTLATAITVRDAASRETLLALGIAPEKPVIAADPAFSFATGAAVAGPNTRSLGVAIRNWNLGVAPEFWEGELARALDSYVERADGSVLFVPFQVLSGATSEDDHTAACRVQGKMRHRDRTTILPHHTDPGQILRTFQGCDAILAMRLHGAILGLCAQRPVVALSYDTKVTEVMTRVGLEDFLIPLSEIDGEKLARKLEQCLSQTPRFAGAFQTVSDLADLARQSAETALNLISAPAPPADLFALAWPLLPRVIRSYIQNFSALQKQYGNCVQDVDVLMRENRLRTEELATWQSSAQDGQDSLVGQLSDLQAALTRLRAENDSSLEESRALRADLGVADQKNAALSAENLLLREEEATGKSVRERLAEDLTKQGEAYEALARELGESRSARTVESMQRAAAEAALDAMTRQNTERQTELAQTQRELEAERDHAAAMVERLSLLEKRIIDAANTFAVAFDEELSSLKRQRAWTAMLGLRKAYSLWMRQGWKGRVASLRIPIDLLRGSAASLANYNPVFPDVWNYLPTPLSSQPLTRDLTLDAPDPGTSAKAAYDVVILPVFNFEFRFQRPQQIACQFAEIGHRVFWISPSRVSQDSGTHKVVSLHHNIWEVRLSSPIPDLYTETLLPNQVSVLIDQLTNLFRTSEIRESVVLLQFPFWRQIGMEIKAAFGSTVVYDCMDDWQNWTAEPKISTFSLAEEKALAKECDILMATSHQLASRMSQLAAREVLRVRNGADYEFFHSPSPSDSLAHLARPIVGYYGAISDWVDVDLMADVAAMRPAYSFVIIGEVHGRDVSRLSALPNVHMLGEKNYRVLPSYLQQFDACLLPFVLNDLTRAVDPVKLYEYLSQGKPVVATPLDEIQACSELLYLAEGAEQFARQLDRALVENSENLRERRTDFAKANSWRNRVESLDTAVAKTFPLVSILIVSYNSREFLAPLFRSIRQSTSYPNYEVIIVDNNSTDGSREWLAANCAKEGFELLALDSNSGFAGGNNIAARRAKGEYLLLLNADVVVTAGWIERLLRPLRKFPDIGMTGPVTNFSGNETRVSTSYRRIEEMEEFARSLSIEQFGRLTDVGMAPLFCNLIPRRVWQEVGELDETFTVGMFEDDDFAQRLKKAGYRIVAVEDCFIHHFGNGSFGKLSTTEALRIFETNRGHFEKKWQIEWQPHKTRPGVRPLSDADRLDVGEFHTAGAESQKQIQRPVLTRLIPDRVTVGLPVNQQQNGDSALVVECEGAVPGTVIEFGTEMLPTSYGSEKLLSGILPSGFSTKASHIPVTLVDYSGRSNTLLFIVESE